MIELPVRRLREDAVLPERAYAGDAGLDLAACEQHELGPGERAVVGTGLAVAIPAGVAPSVCESMVWHWLQSLLMTRPSALTCWPSWQRKHPRK